ncbi:MAG: hypothetical protein IKC38_04530 [Clostridia bacterium]|nr:hypothetical protein [Clostridia bacterium]
MEIVDTKHMTQKTQYTQYEKRHIDSLNKALKKNNIPESYYSLYGYGESCVCLLKREKKWEVFDGEREMKFNVSIYPSIKEACNALISRVSNKSSMEKLLRDFNIFLQLQKTKTNEHFYHTSEINSSNLLDSLSPIRRAKFDARKINNATVKGAKKTPGDKAIIATVAKAYTPGRKMSSPKRRWIITKKIHRNSDLYE